jgi:NAD(P)-dependent dehydrogenase (short-subunit alcohol dehydrogenase family)
VIGIGYELAHQVAACAPAKLILTCRKIANGAGVVKSVLAQHPKIDIEVWELELDNLASVRALVKRANKELSQLDIMCNNAG